MPVSFRSARLPPGLVSVLAVFAAQAQVVSDASLKVSADGKHVFITGSGFTEADEVTVAGIALEKVSVTDTRIDAVLPKGVNLVGGEYIVKVAGKATARGNLHVDSGKPSAG